MLGLMFYRSGRLDIDHDLVVFDADDAEELVGRSRRLSKLEEFVKGLEQGTVIYHDQYGTPAQDSLVRDLRTFLDG
jgi:hypothetical protein